eukprot:gene39253-47737_t
MFEGARSTSAINIAIIQGTMPVFILGLARIAHGARIGPVRGLSAFVTFLGILIVAARGYVGNLGALEVNHGDLLAMGGCALYAVFAVGLRRRPPVSALGFFVGIALGLVLRVVFAALETMATAVALSLGLSSVFAPVEGGESQPSISIFLPLGATTLVFASDLHLEMLRGLAESYTAIPVATGISPGFALGRLVEALSTGFALCLRLLSGPMVFSLFANVAGGLLNRLAPQIQ